MRILPEITTQEQFRELNLRDSVFFEVTRFILSRSNKTAVETRFPSTGSLPVVLIEDSAAMKFYPSIFESDFLNEVKALKFLSSFKVPKIFETGEIHGWRYLLMSQVRGKSLKDAWPALSPEMRQSACHQVGKHLRKIHDLELSQDFDLSSWEAFLSAQKTACFARHEKLGLRKDLLAQIPSFLESVSLTWPRLSFLHTEVMRDHVFFDVSNGEAGFNGFVDFEPSMVGAPEYDFASVGVFLSSGDKRALQAFYQGYGNSELAATKEFRRRIMAYQLLHRFSNLKWYLEFMPNADSLDGLADLWWA